MMMVSSFGVPDECLVAIIRLFETTTTLMTRGKQSRNEEEEEEEEAARGGGKRRRPQRGDHASLRVADVMTKSKFVQLIDLFFRV